MKTLAIITLALSLTGCTQAQRDAYNEAQARAATQPPNPAATAALLGIANQWQTQMHQQQMLNLQRQQIYNAQQPARLQTQCFSFEGILTCR